MLRREIDSCTDFAVNTVKTPGSTSKIQLSRHPFQDSGFFRHAERKAVQQRFETKVRPQALGVECGSSGAKYAGGDGEGTACTPMHLRTGKKMRNKHYPESSASRPCYVPDSA
eukprot:1153471-Pelagomonas_calceolata.AAC.9